MNLITNFNELESAELFEIKGGNIDFTTVIDVTTKFLANRLIWTNAKYAYDHFYTPVIPKGSDLSNIPLEA